MFNLTTSWLPAGIAMLVGLASTLTSGQQQEAQSSVAPASGAVLTRSLTQEVQDSLAFEATPESVDGRPAFVARGNGYGLLLTGKEAVFALAPMRPGNADAVKPDMLRMSVVGGNAEARGSALGRQDAVSHYFMGNDPSKWRTNVPRYGKVRFDEVYPGIDLEYYGSKGELEYDFIVAPGKDPSKIAVRFDGIQGMRLDEEGNLLLKTLRGEMLQHRPVVYQHVNGRRSFVQAAYALQGGNKVGFRLGAYDSSRPLVIDPVLAYSSYLGGNRDERLSGLAVDPMGNIYLGGQSNSSAFPFNRFHGTTLSDGYFGDPFLCKMRPDGATIVYCAFVGGSSIDYGYAVGADRQGNAFLAGTTISADFPIRNADKPVIGSGGSGFLIKFNASGSAVIFSTFVGGTGSAQGLR